MENAVIYKSQGEDSLKSIGQKMLLELNEKIERVIKVKVGYICKYNVISLIICQY